MSKEFFPQRPDSKPTIYAYKDTHPQYKGLLKIGYTAVDVKSRVAQQYPTVRPGSCRIKLFWKNPQCAMTVAPLPITKFTDI